MSYSKLCTCISAVVVDVIFAVPVVITVVVDVVIAVAVVVVVVVAAAAFVITIYIAVIRIVDTEVPDILALTFTVPYFLPTYLRQ